MFGYGALPLIFLIPIAFYDQLKYNFNIVTTFEIYFTLPTYAQNLTIVSIYPYTYFDLSSFFFFIVSGPLN